MFEHVQAYAGDPIFKLFEDFQRDPRPGKINLTIGIYFDDAARLPLMAAVRSAETAMAADIGPRSYLPMSGLPRYNAAVQALLFGADHPALREERVLGFQTLGGSGALKLGGDFLRRWFPQARLWVSDPTWDNHRSLFEGCGFEVCSYPYYDAATGGLRFEALLDALRALPAREIVLLHACCHNPTGVDLAPAQWDRVAAVLRERELIAFVDIAYQGFGEDLDADAYAVRALAAAGVSCFVANSFSKNFSLYGERVGGLSVVCPSAAEARIVGGQLTAGVRRIYSSPPVHGAEIVARVLGDAALRRSWAAELETMRTRMQTMRRRLHEVLAARLPGRDLGRFLTQRGMFSYTGCTPGQVDRLREDFGVYLLRSGRMCVAGLNSGNVQAVAEAFAQVL